MKYGKAEWRMILKNLILTVVGTLILSAGTAIFIIPFDLVAGGVSGLAIVIKQLLPIEWISIDLIVTVLTWSLFFVGLFALGKGFALKTLISSVVYPLGVSLFLRLAEPDAFGGFFSLQASAHSDIALLLGASIGGVLVGAGCAVTFLGGGSTGGVDIIAFTLCKIFKRWKSSAVIFAIDAAVVVLGMFVIGDFVLTLLGVLSAFVSAVMVDKVFLGGSRGYIAHIVTDKYNEINAGVIERLERTTTILDVIGGYTGEGKKMVMVSFTMSQYAELINIINKNDKNAFVTVHRAHEINGEGWTR